MKKRKALSLKNHHARLNLTWYAVVWLLMDRLQPASWVWGAVATVCAFLFLVTLIDIWNCETVELP